MASSGKRRGRHSIDLPEIPEVNEEFAGGFKPAYTPSARNKRAKTENPYISQGQMLNSLAEHSRDSGRYTARKKHTGRNIAIALVLALAVVLVARGLRSPCT